LEGQGNNQQFRQGILTAALIVIAIGGSLGIGTAGGGSSLTFQHGTFTIVMNQVCGGTPPLTLGLACATSTFVRFQTPFQDIPFVETQPNFLTIFQVHVAKYSFLSLGTVPAAWTAMPAAITEIFGDISAQHQLVFEGNNEGQHICGLFVNVVNPGIAGSFLRIQQSFDQITWNPFLLGSGSTGSDVPISTAGINFGADGIIWYQSATLPGPFLRIIGYGGNGVVSPSFSQIHLDCSDYQPTVFNTVTNITTIGFTGNTFFDMPPDNGRTLPYLWSAIA